MQDAASLSDAISTLPTAIRLWVLWLTIAMVGAPLLLLIWRDSRGTALVIAVANISVAVTMHALHAEVGLVRLLGLPHVLIWTPLAAWNLWRLRVAALPTGPRVVLAVFLVSIAVSLVFDYIDVARWLLGDRAPLGAGPG